MTTFSLPNTLVAGTPENINDVQGNFVAVRDHINGNLDTANFATSAKPVTLLGRRDFLLRGGATFTDAMGSALRILGDSADIQPNANGGTVASVAYMYIDPAEFAVSGLTAKLRVRGNVQVNGTAPATNFQTGLHQVTAVGGGADLNTMSVNASAVTDSTFNFTGLLVNSLVTNHSNTFNVPSAGHYALCVNQTGTVAANSRVLVNVFLVLHYE